MELRPITVVHPCYYPYELMWAEANFVKQMNNSTNVPGCACEYNLFYWYHRTLTDELNIFLGLGLKEGAASCMYTTNGNVSIMCGIELRAAKYFAYIYDLDAHPRTYPGFNMVVPQELKDKVAELLAIRRAPLGD